MLRREAFNGAVRRLSNMGYKILLDILVSAQRPLVVAEIPYVFRSRKTWRKQTRFRRDLGIPDAPCSTRPLVASFQGAS